MIQSLLAVAGVIVIVAGTAAGLIVLGWRAKSPLVLRAPIWIAKHGMNRRQMATAGRPGAYAGIIRARGRVSGRLIETPVGIVDAGDAFLVALPYGTQAQWVRNVLAAGEAELVHEGRNVAVDRPELIPTATVADRFPPSDQRLFRVLGVTDCLRLRPVELALAA